MTIELSSGGSEQVTSEKSVGQTLENVASALGVAFIRAKLARGGRFPFIPDDNLTPEQNEADYRAYCAGGPMHPDREVSSQSISTEEVTTGVTPSLG